MNDGPLLKASRRWFELLQRLYPPDFRDEMGAALVEAYMDRARALLQDGRRARLAMLWLRALADSLFNGLAERVRPAVSWRRNGAWGRDIELVGSRLLRAPVFALTTIGTLAVGLGMFAVVYTVAQRVLIDPMPYESSEDLYYVWRDYGPITDLKRGAVGGRDIAELQKAGSVIEDAAGLQRFLGGIFAVREGAEPMEIAVTRASPNLFELLGVTPALGRGFAPDEVGPGREQVMVLTHKLWNRLGAAPDIVGTDVRLQGRPFTVIGVLPPDFTFVRNEAGGPPAPVDAFIPFAVHLADTGTNGAYVGLIRARRGSSPEAVTAAVEAVARVIDARDFDGRGLKLYPVGLKADLISRIRPALVALGAAGLVLLLMLMVNLSSVLMARSSQREHETAVSRALGANVVAVARAILLEGASLGIAGACLGTLAAVWVTSALVAVAPFELPRREAIAIDWRIGAVVIAVGGLMGLLAAAAPAVWAARTSLSSLLAASAVRGGGAQSRWRRGMIVAQVALSFVLLSCGALVVRSLDHLLRADPGFRADGLFTIQLRAPPEFFPSLADTVGFHDRAHAALESIPGVQSVSAASALPLAAPPGQSLVTVPGAPGNTGDAERDRVLSDIVSARAGFIEAMGMRLIAGRTFAKSRREGVMEAMIDTAMAKRLFVNVDDALGATIPLLERRFTVVGVFDHARLYDVFVDGRPQMVIRAGDLGARPLYYVLRTTRDPEALLPEVRAAVRAVDSRVPVGNPRAMDDIVKQSVSPQTMSAALIGAFAAGALLLAAMGLFGVVSGSVTRRRHELAVRLALGADHDRVLGLVLKEGGSMVLIGLLIGAPGVLLAGGLIRGLLVGVSPADPVTLLAAAIGLLAITMATCYAPARRTLTIEPAKLLRQD